MSNPGHFVTASLAKLAKKGRGSEAPGLVLGREDLGPSDRHGNAHGL